MTTHEYYMREALIEAKKARNDGDWAIGCVIIKDGEIIARGRNYVFSQQNRLLHAEVDALYDLQKEYFEPKDNYLTLYTTFDPCPMCLGAILLSRIRHIVIGTNLDKSGAADHIEYVPTFFRQAEFTLNIEKGVLEKECGEMWLSSAPVKRRQAKHGHYGVHGIE